MGLTPGQRAMQNRIEGLIGAAAPALDLILLVGERISRIAEPTDHEYYPIRSGGRVALPGEPDYDPDADPVGPAFPARDATGAADDADADGRGSDAAPQPE